MKRVHIWYAIMLLGEAMVPAASARASAAALPHSWSWATTARPRRLLQAAPQPTAGFFVAPQHHTVQHEFPCGQKTPFCKLCNLTVADIALTCLKAPRCVAFDIEELTGCGYLKAAAGSARQPRDLYVSYCIPTRADDCKGDYKYYPQAELPRDAGNYRCSHEAAIQDTQSKGPTPFCFVEGSINKVSGICSADPECRAFTATTYRKKQGAFLKSQTSPRTPGVGVDVYVKAAAEATEADLKANATEPEEPPPPSPPSPSEPPGGAEDGPTRAAGSGEANATTAYMEHHEKTAVSGSGSDKPTPSSPKLSVPAIIGIVIGGLGAIALVAAVILLAALLARQRAPKHRKTMHDAVGAQLGVVRH